MRIIHAPHLTRKGLGDAVEIVARPIAKAIDAVTAPTPIRTNLANCGGCKKRKEKLNSLFSIGKEAPTVSNGN